MGTTLQIAEQPRNPANGSELESFPFADRADIERLLGSVAEGFRVWRAQSVAERASVFRAIAVGIRRNAESLASSITTEMGKPITQSRAEVHKSADLLDWYAEHGPEMLAQSPTGIGPAAYVAYRPLGSILAVMPWNFPVWQVLRGAAAILIGGNTYIHKPAENVVGTARELERILLEAGLPAGVFVVLNVPRDVVREIIEHPLIAAVAVTGSVRAGSAIAEHAGRAVKKVVLELGGSDPFIVFADADIDGAVAAAITGRFTNSGQVCIAAKRIIVEAPIVEEFSQKFTQKVQELVVGDPTDEDTFVGPIAREDLRDEIARQVAASIAAGASLIAGGASIGGPGFYYAPTVLTNVMPGMTAFDEEIFGPVASIITATDPEHAIQLANHSEFGLSATIWTTDVAMAKRTAARLDTGGVFINGVSVSDPRIPIGGIKKSGFGRDLSSYGVHEFVNVQAVWDQGGRQ